MNEFLTLIKQNLIVTETDINGIISFASAEFCELSGFSEAELLGQNHNIIRHPDTPREYFEAMWRAILSGEVHRGVVKNLRKNGEVFWAQTVIVPRFEQAESGHKLIGFTAFRHDITALMNAREQLLEQQRITLAQSRHAALGQLASSIAHQWRQPLHELSLELFLMHNDAEFQPLASSAQGGSAKEQNAHKMAKNKAYERCCGIIAKMSEMIEDMQRFLRPKNYASKTTMREIFKLALSFMRMSLKKTGLKLRFDGDFSGVFSADAAALAQVLVNLLKNSIEANASEFLISCKQSADAYNIDICDDGSGLSEQAAEAVFDAYFTSKNPSGGVGLGMYICKQIINAHGGQINVSAGPLKGAAFKIYLPK